MLFLVRSLNRGGAERQLVTLARLLAERGHAVTVVTFYAGGALEKDLSGSGVHVTTLGKRGRWDLLGPIASLRSMVRQTGTDIVHSYLTDANVLAALAKPLLGGAKLVWGVRAADMPWHRYGWAARLSFHISRALSRAADLIIFNSEAGRRYHCAKGYGGDDMVVVPNGFDTTAFQPNPAERVRLRRELGVAETGRLVGVVGRLDPAKGYELFLDAAAMLVAQDPTIAFICVGGGDETYGATLQRRAHVLGLGSRVAWLGERADMVAVYNALDILVLASVSEGMPNVVGEAMACGTLCVVTGVGDSAILVGDTGGIAGAGNAASIAAEVARLLNVDEATMAQRRTAARQRICIEFDLNRLAERTDAALSQWA